jgi:pimeloyl-ACP methyl ester carboxylesterase
MLLLALTLLATDSARSFRVPVSPSESLYVEATGEGEPVVLIPGLFGSAFAFRQLVPLIVHAGYRAIVIEPLGIGLSSRPGGADYSLYAQAERIAAVFHYLGLQHVMVVAHSLGGAMAFRVAYRHPELAMGLLSIEGGPTERATTPAFRRAMRFAPLIRLFGGMKLVRKKIKHSLIDSSGDASWVTDSVVHGYTAGAAHDLGAALRAFSGMAKSVEPEPLQPHLREIRCPVRLLVGTARHDGDVSADEILILQQNLPEFAVERVEGAGHFIQEEQPRSVMAAFDQLEQTVKQHAN